MSGDLVMSGSRSDEGCHAIESLYANSSYHLYGAQVNQWRVRAEGEAARMRKVRVLLNYDRDRKFSPEPARQSILPSSGYTTGSGHTLGNSLPRLRGYQPTASRTPEDIIPGSGSQQVKWVGRLCQTRDRSPWKEYVTHVVQRARLDSDIPRRNADRIWRMYCN